MPLTARKLERGRNIAANVRPPIHIRLITDPLLREHAVYAPDEDTVYMISPDDLTLTPLKGTLLLDKIIGSSSSASKNRPSEDIILFVPEGTHIFSGGPLKIHESAVGKIRPH